MNNKFFRKSGGRKKSNEDEAQVHPEDMMVENHRAVDINEQIDRIFNGGSENSVQVDAIPTVQISMADAARMIQDGELLGKEAMVSLVDHVYPEKSTPSLQALINSVTEEYSETGLEWKQGSWVEFLGSDMKWHLSQVRRVVRQAPDNWDWADDRSEPPWNYYYNVADRMLLSSKEIRAPQEALQAVFGMRPWVWQQYVLLKMERHTRFQRDSERDFEEVDFEYYATEKFEKWLDHPSNKDFKDLYESHSTATQERLLDHLVKPFQIMDEIVTNKTEWDLNDQNISVYTYMSVLGGGLFVFAICLMVQLVVPFVLLYTTIQNTDRYPNLATNASVNEIFHEVFESSCDNSNLFGDNSGMILNLAVLLIYITKVLPSTALAFMRASGTTETTYGRIIGLRRILWEQGSDTFLQQFGHRIETYMQTSYVSLLYAIMLFILYNTNDAIEVVLNALAIEFIHQIDEQVANSQWYDNSDRWMRAGIIEMVFRCYIDTHHLENMDAFEKKYDINHHELKAEFGKQISLKDRNLALKNDKEIAHKSGEDAVWLLCAEWAKKRNNKQALKQFRKPKVHFGVLFSILGAFELSKTGMFHRYQEYRTWSRLERIMYMSKLPHSGTSKRGALVQRKLKKNLPADTPAKQRLMSTTKDYVWDIIDSLSFRPTIATVYTMVKRKRFLLVPWKLLDGVIGIIAVLVLIAFPFYIVFMVGFVMYCY